ncbi:2TM domain-containing protein [Winogradskyella sp. UBA3174]|uniref:2TM domain-containing protein n=1 Tax=Winogradskyella sp. UBA3174 TaxID=1947785 RepID=UPI0025D9BFB7|nr:2TM domain-containing protein [Winogradskyella sp. UBA3174]|tara:strand:- start:79276 stop:79620 length:345 start_codon:yes stop_codon:yes gene_type:complete
MEKFSIEPYENEDNVSDFRKEEAYLIAKKKVDALIGFYWHFAVYLVINIFLIILIGVNDSEGFSGFGPYATAVFWGIGLFFHFIGVFGPNFFFGNNWEKRKIDEYMDKERKNWE